MNTVKMAKVITLWTKEGINGTKMHLVTTVPAEAEPKAVFKSIGLEGFVKSYEVSANMPLPIALAYSEQLMKQYHII